jgi:PIN domain nuclease of toxin-antitoxin system
VVSVASAWEIAIKVQIGKLRLPDHVSAASYMQSRAARDHMEILPINLHHVEALHTLPLRHRDPFDRILIAQSLVEELPILTGDEQISGYAVDSIW